MPRGWRRCWQIACLLLIAFAPVTEADAAEPKRLLLLHSYGRDFAPWSDFTRNMRAELDRQGGTNLDIYEATLASARFADPATEDAFAEYLRSLFVGRRLDLVVTIGGPAAGFFQKHRQKISPDSPLLLSALDQRRVALGGLGANDAALSVTIDLTGVMSNLLQVLPETKNIVIVLGNSPLERYWSQELREAIRPLADRVTFTWFNELPFEEILSRAASLPPHSAIFYSLFAVDAAGTPHEESMALDRLHAVANAPIFSFVDTYFGRGLLGGSMLSTSDVSRQTAATALRLLRGEAPAMVRPSSIGFAPPRFDWREMSRWNVAQSALPAGSAVLFRQPTTFELYRWYILGAIALMLVQALLIVALLFNQKRLVRERSERQQAETIARDFSGRLITAQEDERSRLARELHDDVTQRLALLAIEAGRHAPGSSTINAPKIHDGLVRLSEDVHALSYRLHPSILDDLGLSEALRTECERFSRVETLPVKIDLQTGPDIPQQLSLCLFRVAQEALRNVGRHAQARNAEVSLQQSENGFELRVSDDGVGFNPALRDHVSLGLASMRQRVYLLGGTFAIESTPGHGTTVLASIPLLEKHHAPTARAAG